ncbi:alpha/beta hydrolase [Rhizobium sp. 18055]|uniref:alpha/beta hydrolase n=1 Tax=Rhizobium sp. 18055 TaxID=2681403 RepID=UPI0013588DC2|nr:alpha/beta hydrolase [Rhizobium sp. 18055]
MLTRRSMLGTISAATLLPLMLPGKTLAAAPATSLPLWPGQPPGGGGPTGPVSENARGAISNIAVPVVEVFAPAKPNGIAMLIAGGGGYRRISMRNEARPAARWLNARGITAFVLSYRLPGEGWSAGPLAPLQDAQRAIRLIRANAGRFSIDRQHVGVLGFSAGGHLLGLAATRSAFASYQPIDAADTQSARPDFAALIYPVITLKPPYDHTSTRRILIGKHPSAATSAEWSVEDHVQAQCPPMFLVQAKDDPVSDPENTLIMQQACETANVPVEFHPLENGGHGFGMGKPGTASAEWPAYFSPWLERINAPIPLEQ